MVKKLVVNGGFVWVDNIDFEYLSQIDGNKKNNTRANLRVCTQSENLKNSKLRGKGYFFDKGKGKWRVMFKGKHVAYCTTEEEAIKLVRGTRKGW